MRWDVAADEAAVRLQRLAEVGSILLDEEAADLRAVLYGLRCYKFERDGAEAAVERIKANWSRTEAERKATLHRVRLLVNHKRKTLAMADLTAALDPRHLPAQDAETDRTGDGL